ncbi:glutathione peroxidase [Anaerobacillus sp. MEB173]|uniref:glutathione peroxidase n=1 Tax=Anaerobacillus sp. MEB173 TaxID=3383345 RepID=UPI003F8DBCE7
MSIYDINVKTIKGDEQSLAQYKGNVLLIVNTASKCGFTKQYAGLQALYEKYKDEHFEILGFPSNQFAGQEPEENEEILSFCELNFGVTFPLFTKTDVKGSAAHPLFQYLTDHAPGLLGIKAVKWNFTKFLVDRNGNVIKRYAPNVSPEKIETDIKQLL